MQDSEANICVMENDAQLQKILQVRDRLPHLRAVIQYTGELSERYSNVYSVSIIMLLLSEKCPTVNSVMAQTARDRDLDRERDGHNRKQWFYVPVPVSV